MAVGVFLGVRNWWGNECLCPSQCPEKHLGMLHEKPTHHSKTIRSCETKDSFGALWGARAASLVPSTLYDSVGKERASRKARRSTSR